MNLSEIICEKFLDTHIGKIYIDGGIDIEGCLGDLDFALCTKTQGISKGDHGWGDGRGVHIGVHVVSKYIKKYQNG